MGKNYKHYEDLGYKIPKYKNYCGRTVVKRGTVVTVDVKDLPRYSKVNVLLKCDNCGEEYTTSYSNYLSHNHKGKTYCKHCHSKVFTSGENNYNWNPNLTEEDRIINRNTEENIIFKKKVMARDNYTCQCCGKKINNDGVVHHLDGHNWCKEKRTDETNGITLCEKCHKNFHSIYGYGNNTKEQFEEWIGQAVNLLKYNEELPTTKKVYCVDSGKTYNSVKELQKELKLKGCSGIYKACNHRELNLKVRGMSFMWLYDAIKFDSHGVGTKLGE